MGQVSWPSIPRLIAFTIPSTFVTGTNWNRDFVSHLHASLRDKTDGPVRCVLSRFAPIIIEVDVVTDGRDPIWNTARLVVIAWKYLMVCIDIIGRSRVEIDGCANIACVVAIESLWMPYDHGRVVL